MLSLTKEHFCTFSSSMKPEYLASWIQNIGVNVSSWIFRRTSIEASLPFLPLQKQKSITRILSGSLDSMVSGVGVCLVLFAGKEFTEEECGAFGADIPLKDAFLLPFVWEENKGHSPHLPSAMSVLADLVCCQFERTDEGSSWGLQPHFSWENCDLSALDWSCDSAWGALAVGLLLAKEGLKTKADILISAAWDEKEGGVAVVSKMKAKFSLASAYKASTFFVADSQMDCESAHSFEVKRFGPEKQPHKVLGPLLEQLAFEPKRSESASYELRLRYANHILRNRSKRDDYLCKQLTVELASGLADKVHEDRLFSDFDNIDTLQVIMSSRSLALLSILSCRPKRCLVFYTERDRADIPKLIDDLLFSDFTDCELFSCEVVKRDFQKIGRIAHLFFKGRKEGSLSLADVTGGLTAMKSALLLATTELNGVGSYCVESGSIIASNMPRAGSELLLPLVRPEQTTSSVFFESNGVDVPISLEDVKTFREESLKRSAVFSKRSAVFSKRSAVFSKRSAVKDANQVREE